MKRCFLSALYLCFLIFSDVPSYAQTASYYCIAQRIGNVSMQGELPNTSCDFIKGQFGLKGQSDWESKTSCKGKQKEIYVLEIGDNSIKFGKQKYGKFTYSKRIFEDNGGGITGVHERGPYARIVTFYPSMNYLIYSSIGNGSGGTEALSCVRD